MAPHFSIHCMRFTADEAECQQREGLRTLSYEECMIQMLKCVSRCESLRKVRKTESKSWLLDVP